MVAFFFTTLTIKIYQRRTSEHGFFRSQIPVWQSRVSSKTWIH